MLPAKVVVAVDSIGAAKAHALNLVRAFLQVEYHEASDGTPGPFDWTGWRTASLCKRTPAQTDGSSCGVYALLAMRALARRVSLGRVLVAQRICGTPSYWRRRLAFWLTVGKII